MAGVAARATGIAYAGTTAPVRAVIACSSARKRVMSVRASRIERKGSLVPAICLDRPVDVPGLFGGAATEGTVFPTMTDIDGSAAGAPEISAPEKPPETDAELTARYERDAIALL